MSRPRVNNNSNNTTTLPPLRAADSGAVQGRPTLNGHDLMSIFPTSQAPSQTSTAGWFGKQEREYLSSTRDEHKSRRVSPGEISSSSSASSSSSSSSSNGPYVKSSYNNSNNSYSNSRTSSPASSDSSSTSSSSPSPKVSAALTVNQSMQPSMHVFSTRTLNPPTREKPTRGGAAPSSSASRSVIAARMQPQTIPQGSGDTQFSILRMPLESFSNPNSTTSQLSEFRAQKTGASPPPNPDIDAMFSAWRPPSPDRRRSGKHTKRVVRVQ